MDRTPNPEKRKRSDSASSSDTTQHNRAQRGLFANSEFNRYISRFRSPETTVASDQEHTSDSEEPREHGQGAGKRPVGLRPVGVPPREPSPDLALLSQTESDNEHDSNQESTDAEVRGKAIGTSSKDKGKEVNIDDKKSDAQIRKELRDFLNTNTGRMLISNATSDCNNLKNSKKCNPDVLANRQELYKQCDRLYQFVLDDKGGPEIKATIEFLENIDDIDSYMNDIIQSKNKRLRDLLEFTKKRKNPCDTLDISNLSQQTGFHENRAAQDKPIPQVHFPSDLEEEGHLTTGTYQQLMNFRYLYSQINDPRRNIRIKEDLTYREKRILAPALTSDRTAEKFIRLVKDTKEMRPLKDLQVLAQDLLKNEGKFSKDIQKDIQKGNWLNNEETESLRYMINLALVQEEYTPDNRKVYYHSITDHSKYKIDYSKNRYQLQKRQQ